MAICSSKIKLDRWKGVIDIVKNILRISSLIFILILVFILIQNVYNKYQTEEGSIGKSEKAPNFKLASLSGEDIELEKLKGKGILVNFWATWCDPCTEEMLSIQKVYDTYKTRGFEVLSINIGEDRNQINEFLKENRSINFPVLLGDNFIIDNYKIMSTPTTYFVKPDGTIDRYHEGKLSEEQLHTFVKDILPSK